MYIAYEDPPLKSHQNCTLNCDDIKSATVAAAGELISIVTSTEMSSSQLATHMGQGGPSSKVNLGPFYLPTRPASQHQRGHKCGWFLMMSCVGEVVRWIHNRQVGRSLKIEVSSPT